MEKLERELSDIIDEADSWEYINFPNDYGGENYLTTNKDLLLVLLQDYITKNFTPNGNK